MPCPYCQRIMEHRTHPRLAPTRDHVIPASRGGRVWVICCITCNGIKSNMMPEEWTAFMLAYPKWWLLTKLDLRAIRRRSQRAEDWRLRSDALDQIRGRPSRQGSRPPDPVVVPPELIWQPSPD